MSAITKNNVRNRQNTLKDTWGEVHDLFSELSRFVWDQSSKVFEVECGWMSI